ncbi:MAG: histidine phosphatase family protein, partial [Pseudomonadota bacterium]
LTIIRHAKSDWPESTQDFDRPLLKRGIEDARLLGKHMRESNYNFDAVICSGALRARQTLENIRAEFSIAENKIQFQENIYMASLTSTIKLIEALPKSLNWTAIVGHNPTQTELCNYFANDHLSNMPTCGVYTISFQVDDWKAIGYGLGNCVSLVTPKMLKQQ